MIRVENSYPESKDTFTTKPIPGWEMLLRYTEMFFQFGTAQAAFFGVD
jgi:hypothetical protein